MTRAEYDDLVRLAQACLAVGLTSRPLCTAPIGGRHRDVNVKRWGDGVCAVSLDGLWVRSDGGIDRPRTTRDPRRAGDWVSVPLDDALACPRCGAPPAYPGAVYCGAACAASAEGGQ